MKQLLGLWLSLGALGCATAGPRLPAAGQPIERGLPPLRVEAIAEPQLPPSAPASGARVTLRAVDADLRPLLVALAQMSGVNLILSPGVRGRVSLTLDDVPAEEAWNALLEAVGLSAPTALRAPWGPTVFFHPPVTLDTLDAETISRRFGVSRQLAAWIVEERRR